MSATRVYLFRHGRVQAGAFDSLSIEGERFRDALPGFIRRECGALDGAFFDSSVERCRQTIERLDCVKGGYGVDQDLRTLNAVLSSLSSGAFALCCRGDSIESGQLYHVDGFSLHTPFRMADYGSLSRRALQGSYGRVFCLELINETTWRQAWEKVVKTEASAAR